MTQDQEDISLKILRVLYHYHQDNPLSGLDIDKLLRRFDFSDAKEGKTKIEKALSDMIQANMIHLFAGKQGNKPSVQKYTITEQGIQHYNKFKHLKEESVNPLNGVSVYGDWKGDYQQHNHYNISRGGDVHFPGETEEFIHHYDELMKEIEETESMVLDSPNGEKILEKLARIKTIINLDSSALGGRLKWEQQITQMLERLQDKIN